MPVVAKGVVELRKALKQYAPDLRKQMDSEIRTVLKGVVADAEAKVPSAPPGGLYNWADKGSEPKSITGYRAFPKYDAGLIRNGMTYSMGRTKRNRYGFAGLYSLFNKDAAGMIIEFAGRVHPYGRTQKADRKFGQSHKDIGRSNNPDAGRRFTLAMNELPLKKFDNNERNRGRLLYAAYADNQGRALNAIFKALNKAQEMFNARVSANAATTYGKAA